MSATKKQKVLTQLELMINSTNPDFAPPAESGHPKERHERFQEFRRQVEEAADDDPIIDTVAREIGLPD
ncbi:hypothetical protein SIM91_05035 [Rhodococcus opacus]|uniref:hypothetical protein n=1 Tax=Rhodococcus opacus TaxID=37919 RepID=UPI0002A467C1|nr:hypothetical protein [Rhodococcus opacus]ELB86007.1 hypothetical protein Rwratislav_47105 [Rhodococcus wratislaviensis IFP 2016]MDX5962688.1 hypothetical protein [Rhodococcus opacus]CAG7636467.1 hypothetical protein E143388_07797 [Rhodococcus opacus]